MLTTVGTDPRISVVAALERRPVERSSEEISSFLIDSGASRTADLLASTLASA